jgi:hypothetical protein
VQRCARRALSGGAVDAAAEIAADAASLSPPAPSLTALDFFLAPIHAVLEGVHTVIFFFFLFFPEIGRLLFAISTLPLSRSHFY